MALSSHFFIALTTTAVNSQTGRSIIYIQIITANEVWDKVVFSQVFVCPRGRDERGVCLVKGGVVKGVVKERCSEEVVKGALW